MAHESRKDRWRNARAVARGEALSVTVLLAGHGVCLLAERNQLEVAPK